MTTSPKRARYRRFPDWVETLPGWLFRKTVHSNFTGTPDTTTVISRGNFSASDYPSSLPRGQEHILDENHIGKLKSFKEFEFTGDVGGEFFLRRSGVVCPEGSAQHVRYVEKLSQQNTTYEYHGPVLAYPPNLIALPPDPSQPDLGPLGTHAIAMCKPTNAVANLAVDLAETKQEGLPHLQGAHLWRDKTLTAKNAGSEYLNQEFGWDPLVSDIRNASYAAANAHKILSSYERNSHKMVRRRYEFPVVKTESWDRPFSFSSRAYVPGDQQGKLFNLNGPRGSIVRCTRVYERTWFSGAFTYHLPIGYESRNKLISAAAKAGPLLGIKLSPETVWQATPWTWALDWFSNVGDVVSIMSDMSTDGLVIKYGYVMQHSVVSQTYYFIGDPGFWPGSYSGDPTPITAFVEIKRRKRATPFGFEIGWEGLSFRQLAISAALGLTRWF